MLFNLIGLIGEKVPCGPRGCGGYQESAGVSLPDGYSEVQQDDARHGRGFLDPLS